MDQHIKKDDLTSATGSPVTPAVQPEVVENKPETVDPGKPADQTPAAEAAKPEVQVVQTVEVITSAPSAEPTEFVIDDETKAKLEKAGKSLKTIFWVATFSVLTVAILGGVGAGLCVSALVAACGGGSTASAIVGTIFGVIGFLSAGVIAAIAAFFLGAFRFIDKLGGMKKLKEMVEKKEAAERAAREHQTAAGEPTVLAIEQKSTTSVTEGGAEPVADQAADKAKGAPADKSPADESGK